MAACDRGETFTPPTLEEILPVVARHIRAISEGRGDRHGGFLVRKHIVRYFRSFPGAADIRRRLFATEDGTGMQQCLAEITAEVHRRRREIDAGKREEA